MGREEERRMAELEVQDEVLDADYQHLSRKARNRIAREQLGPDWKQQVADGARVVLTTAFKEARKIKVNEKGLSLHSMGGNGSHLREMSDPRMLRR